MTWCRRTLKKTLNIKLTTTQTTGYNKVNMLNCSRAIIPNAWRKAVSSQVKRVSSCGLFQDFLMVGPKPSTSVATINITDQTGWSAPSQRKSATKENSKNATSKNVMFFSPYFRDKKKIKIQIAETANVIHDPTPAPPCTCNAQVIELATPQIKNVKVCGTVFLLMMSRM